MLKIQEIFFLLFRLKKKLENSNRIFLLLFQLNEQ